MNEKEIIRAMSGINEDFVEEAAAAADSGAKAAGELPYSQVSADKAHAGADAEYIRIRKPKKKTLKWAGGIAAALAVCVLGASIFGGGLMGGGAKAAYDSSFAVNQSAAPAASTPMAPAGGASSYGGYDVDKNAVAEAEMPAADNGWFDEEGFEYSKAEDAAAGSDARVLGSEQADKTNMKLIYRADLSLQTTDFDETEAQIKAMCESHGGYIQDSWFNTGGYYSSSTYKEGNFTVRIPSDHYKAFVNAVGDSCHVTSINESVEDIGLQYYETEARLETLRTKEKRLHELLEEAAGLSDIIQLESALSDTEYEIDLYTSQLRRYDSLVGYSTVTIYLQQVEKPQDPITQDNSFGARLKRAFENGWDNFVSNIEWFIIDLSYDIYGILLFAVIVAAGFFIIRAIVRKVKKNKAKKNAAE